MLYDAYCLSNVQPFRPMVVYTSTSRHLFGKRLWYCFLRSQLRPLVKPVPNLVLLLFVYINPALLLRLRLRAKTLDLCLSIFRSARYILIACPLGIREDRSTGIAGTSGDRIPGPSLRVFPLYC